MPTSSTSFVNGQFNGQWTDKPSGQLRTVIKACDLLGLNEVEAAWQRLIIKTSLKFGSHPLLGAAGADPIMWRKSRFAVVAKSSRKAYSGEKGVTPSAYVNEVTLRDKVTGKIVTRINAHPPAHIEVAGRARVYTGNEAKKYAGQHERARAIFALLRARVVARALTADGAAIVGGDFNVDRDAELRLPAAKRVPWFPLTALGSITTPAMPKGGSHGSRAIDWVLIRGPIKSVRNWYGPQGASDHKPVYTELEFT